MAITNAYVQTYGQIPAFFAKIQEGQAPERFSGDYLVDLGFESSNHRAFIPLLKALAFLSPDGRPTQRYHDYRNKAEAAKVMGQALRDAYGDIFKIVEFPKKDDLPRIEGKFKSAHNVSDVLASRMAQTFLALLGIADLSGPPSPPAPEKAVKTEKVEPPAPTGTPPAAMHGGGGHARAALHYNIQIHLPATKDVEVYNAIFKSLKEHLLE